MVHGNVEWSGGAWSNVVALGRSIVIKRRRSIGECGEKGKLEDARGQRATDAATAAAAAAAGDRSVLCKKKET